MSGDVIQNAAQGAYFKEFMGGDSNMVFAFGGSGKPYMTAGLPGYFIAVFLQEFCEFYAADFPGKFHIAITSSFTMCKRTIWGISFTSKWHFIASLMFSFNSSNVSPSV
jgi:hypothetical protein